MYFNKLKRKFKYSKKRRSIYMLLLISILCLGIGYAYISTTLEINGETMFRRSTWDVYLDNSTISIESGSVTPITPVSATGTNISFSTRLENKGDYYCR